MAAITSDPGVVGLRHATRRFICQNIVFDPFDRYLSQFQTRGTATELADATRPDVVDERKCVRRRTADACRQAFVFRVPI